MNDKTAHNKLKKIQEDNNKYRNSRREKSNRHEIMNETLREIESANDKYVE